MLVIFYSLYRSDCKFSSNDTQAAGQVTIWKIPELSLVTQITGSTEHSHYGSSLAVGYPYTDNEEAVLAVGMDSIGTLRSRSIISAHPHIHILRCMLFYFLI